MKTNEHLWWSLFVVGGTAALLVPATAILTGIGIAAGWVTAESLGRIVRLPLVRVYLFAVVAFPLFHAAHRIRLVFRDEGLRSADLVISWVLYGAAAVGTALAVVLLVRL